MDFISHQAEKILACYTNSSLSSCINKAEENDIEKGGEGARGGIVIGHTISGKPIYKKSTGANTSNFSSTDHHNAYAAHEQARSKMSKFSESGEKNKDFEHHSKMMMFHKQGAANKSYDEKF